MNLIKKIRKSEEGFTLVELVIVIAILAVLAALLVPRIMGNVEDAKRSQAIADARTIATEITVYNAQAKAYEDMITEITDDALGKIKRTTEDLQSKYVEISIDSAGNATVEIKSDGTQ
ncbi:MAG: prepilin-type N-terminal cleavage/methylation domain-containing protein [Clostridiales bacterium]|nr:prepilin-type N-terminal cleavage/methylation domain-containing protein [Clostridiales bacterium]